MSFPVSALLFFTLALPAAPAPKVRATVSLAPASAKPGDRVDMHLDLEIKTGWHIYAPNFTGTGIPTALKLQDGPLAADGKLVFPEPKKQTIEVLNETVLYHERKVRYTQPLRVSRDAAPGLAKIAGKLKYMACTDAVCDQPVDLPIEAEFEIAAATASAAPEIPALPDLGGPKLTRNRPAPAAKVKFTIEIEPAKIAPGGSGEVVLRYDVEKNSYIYGPDQNPNLGTPTRIVVPPELGEAAGPAAARPPSKDKEIKELNEIHKILDGKGELRQPFRVARSARSGAAEFSIGVKFMVCDASTCTPGEFEAKAKVEIGAAAAPIEEPERVVGEAEEPVRAKPPEDRGLLAWVLLAIGWGLFALVMPCTYPMIPITISFFTKQADIRKASPIGLALAYGAGIVADFVLIGLLVGPAIQPFANHWLTNGVFALLFVAFSLSLLGLYEIRLPSSVNALAGRAAGVGGYFGVFLLGSTLVITSFTCTAPVVGAVLGEGARLGTTVTIVSMTTFGLTMALPFVALAFFPNAARSLPRSGEWLHTLKVTLGFIELAAALKFISNVDVSLDARVFPRELFLYLLTGICLVTALYLFGLVRMKGETGEVGPMRLTFALMLVLFSFYCLHGVRHRLDFVMEAFVPPYRSEEEKASAWTQVIDDFEGGLARAEKEGKLALINWTGFL